MCRRTLAPSFTETAIAELLLVDTNILIEATDTRCRFHGDATALIDAVGARVFPAQVIREYLVLATRPVNVNGLGMSLHDALENIGEFRKDHTAARRGTTYPACLPAATGGRALLPGARIHDAQLVATAIVHHVRTIVSLNPDDLLGFTSEIAVVGPAEALGERTRPRRPPR